MAANYWESSQRLYWQFTKSELREARDNLLQTDKDLGATDLSLTAYNYQIRLYIHCMIQVLGRHLNVRQRVLATAEVYIARFFTKATIQEVNVYLVIASCIYVACKAEECPQHIRTIASEARSLWPEYITHDATKIAECEFYIMEELDTHTIVHHPYKPLTEISRTMTGQLALSQEELQSTWSMINDSYATDLILLYAPHIVAMACIYITIVLKSPLMRPSRPPERIKARIDLLVAFLGESGIDLDKMADCIQEMISLYSRWENYDEESCKQLLKKHILKTT